MTNAGLTIFVVLGISVTKGTTKTHVIVTQDKDLYGSSKTLAPIKPGKYSATIALLSPTVSKYSMCAYYRN